MVLKGYKQSAEHIAKRIKRGPDHPNWKGDAITVKSGRCRALRVLPVIGECARCGEPAIHRHHIDGNTRNNDPSNIEPLCARCHLKAHNRLEQWADQARRRIKETTEAAAQEKRNRTHCKRGHPLSGDNLYINNTGGKTARVCIECRKLHKQAYLQRRNDTTCP
jgi:5-methylcytosine-specific restriction endonuclease McrA